MAKSATLSLAKTPKELDKAYSIAAATISKIGIKITLKKVPPTIEPAMAKSGKPANFELSGDADSIKVSVETEGVSSVLGTFDVDKEKDNAKRAGIVRGLSTNGLLSTAERDKALVAISPLLDPKYLASLEKEEAAASKKVAELQKLLKDCSAGSYDDLAKVPELMDALEAYSKKAHSMENLNFLAAINANKKDDFIIKEFIAEKSKQEINIDSPLRQEIVAKEKKPTAAVAEVKKMILTNELKTVKSRMLAELKEEIEAEEKTLKGAATMRQKLGA